MGQVISLPSCKWPCKVPVFWRSWNSFQLSGSYRICIVYLKQFLRHLILFCLGSSTLFQLLKYFVCKQVAYQSVGLILFHAFSSCSYNAHAASVLPYLINYESLVLACSLDPFLVFSRGSVLLQGLVNQEVYLFVILKALCCVLLLCTNLTCTMEAIPCLVCVCICQGEWEVRVTSWIKWRWSLTLKSSSFFMFL